MHKEINKKTDVGKQTELLNSRHHGEKTRTDDDKLECEYFGDHPAFFFESECDSVSHVQIERCRDHRFGEYDDVLESDEDDEIWENLAAVECGCEAKVGANAD